MLIKVIEPIVYLIIIVNLVIAISYKRKSKKTPVKVVAPIVILGIGLFVCDTVYTHRSFSSVEKAVEAYGDNAEIIRILQGENSTYVIMDNEGTVEGKIFPESSGKWKLPDSIFYGTGRDKMRVYSFHNYLEFAIYVMDAAKGPRIFKRQELSERLRISTYKLEQILLDTALDADMVNQDFVYYLDETNSWRKPLVRLDADTYFCLDGRMAGYGFYEVMFQILFAKYGTKFSRNQGEYLEQLVYQMFREKRFSYITGQYYKDGDLAERDCDMILEGKERVMFVEIKKCPLPGSYEKADDVSVLSVLGDGMLYAQEQILWHRIRLKEKGLIALYDKLGNHIQDYIPGRKPVMAMSICMPEYDFLTDRMMTENFLESVLRVTYHAKDQTKEKNLDRLNKRIENIQLAAARLFDGMKYTTRDVFFNSLFRSLQQVWTMLRVCDTQDVFLDMCATQLVMITGAGDVYVDIWNALQLKG